MNIALADEFKLFETYLLSSQTINRKLPISCKNRSGKYGFSATFDIFRLVSDLSERHLFHYFTKSVRRAKERQHESNMAAHRLFQKEYRPVIKRNKS